MNHRFTHREQFALSSLRDGVATAEERALALELLAQRRIDAEEYLQELEALDSLVYEAMRAREADHLVAVSPSVPHPSRLPWRIAAAAAAVVTLAAATHYASLASRTLENPPAVAIRTDEPAPEPDLGREAILLRGTDRHRIAVGAEIVGDAQPTRLVLRDGTTMDFAAGARAQWLGPRTVTLHAGEALVERPESAPEAVALTTPMAHLEARHGRTHLWADADQSAVVLASGSASLRRNAPDAVAQNLDAGSVVWAGREETLAVASLPPAFRARLAAGPGALERELTAVRQLALGARSPESTVLAMGTPPALKSARAELPFVVLGKDDSAPEPIVSIWRQAGGVRHLLYQSDKEPKEPTAGPRPQGPVPPDEPLLFLAEQGDRAAWRVVSAREAKNLSAELEPVSHRTISVADPSGRPIPHAQAWIRRPHESRERARLVTADGEGRLLLPLRAGASLIDLRARGYLPVLDWYADAARPTPPRLALEPAPLVLIATLDGPPVPGELLPGLEVVAPNGERTFVDERGAFSFTQQPDGRPRAVTVHTRKRGAYERELLLEGRNAQLKGPWLERPKRSTQHATHSLRGAIALREDGPASSTTLVFRDDSGTPLAVTTTDARGSWTLDSPPLDIHTVDIVAPGYELANERIPSSVDPIRGIVRVPIPATGLPETITLQSVPPHSFSIVKQDGTPIAHTPIRMDYLTSDGTTILHSGSLVTDERGIVQTTTVPREGRIVLTVPVAALGWPSRDFPLSAWSAALPDGTIWYLPEPEDVRIQLPRELRDANACVEVLRLGDSAVLRGDTIPWLRADSTLLRVPALVPGVYEFRAVIDGIAGPPVEVPIRSGRVAPTIRLQAPPR